MPKHYHTPAQRTKLRRLRKKGHSPAGARYLIEQEEKKKKGKKIEYYGQKRETADAILRRIKRGK